MKSMRFTLVASLAMLALAGQAFAQKGPKAPKQAPQDQDEQEFEEQYRGPKGHKPPLPPRGPMGPGMEERNPAAEREAMDYLKSQVPELDEELERLQREKPDAFHMKFREFMFAYRDPSLRDQYISGLKADFRVRRLVKEVREAKGGEKDKIKADLEKALSDQFDSNLVRMEFKLKRMETEIGQLKTRIEKRRSLKDQIVKKRLGELSGETETWEW